MAKFNVVMTAPRLAGRAVALIEAAGGTLHFMPPYPAAEAVAELAGRVRPDPILSRQGPVTAVVMDRSPGLRVIARQGVSVDGVDVAEAHRRGIVVTRAPGSNTRAVAEHTFALLLALAKQLPTFAGAIAGGWWRTDSTKVRDVAGMRLGIVGLGDIGRAVAHLGLAFGMRVSVFDPAAAGMAGVERAESLLALLSGSDVLTLHCPKVPGAPALIGAAELTALPAGALVLNTARGGLIDEAALQAALDQGHVGGAGLDVFATEPPDARHPLRRHPRVIVSPHVAGVTESSLDNMGVTAAECIVAVLTGGTVPPGRVVSPEPSALAAG